MKAPIYLGGFNAGSIDGHRVWLSSNPDPVRGSVMCTADNIEAIQITGTPDELEHFVAVHRMQVERQHPVRLHTALQLVVRVAFQVGVAARISLNEVGVLRRPGCAADSPALASGHINDPSGAVALGVGEHRTGILSTRLILAAPADGLTARTPQELQIILRHRPRRPPRLQWLRR